MNKSEKLGRIKNRLRRINKEWPTALAQRKAVLALRRAELEKQLGKSLSKEVPNENI